jgi:uncharacterized protein YyaL (SSP411 family)
MLYDNALLVMVYSEALQAIGPGPADLYRRTIEDTLGFVERELTDEAGGFHSSLDADSEGEEGKFYVWTADEVEEALGAEKAAFFSHFYDVTAEGNWEERNVLWLRRPLAQLAHEAGLEGSDEEVARTAEARLRPLREKLLAVRSPRIRPGLDDKVLTGWNGLMISAFCRAAQALGRTEVALPAARAARFLIGNVVRDGRLFRSWRRGHAHLNAYLEDYSFLASGLIDLYETTFELHWLEAAERLVDTTLRHFSDPAGGFYFTSDDHEELLARPRNLYDGAVPSGGSMMVHALLRLSLLLDRPEWREAAEKALSRALPGILQVPGGHHLWIAATDWLAQGAVEVAFAGRRESSEGLALLDVVRRKYLPNRALAWLDPDDERAVAVERTVALLKGKKPGARGPLAFVCRNYACGRPAATPEDLEKDLAGSRPVSR